MELRDKNFEFQDIFVMGDVYSMKISRGMSNGFWREVFESFSLWQLKLQRLRNDRLRTPIWYNSDIKRERTVILPGVFGKGFQRGVTEIGDFYNLTGSVMKFEEFCSIKGIPNTPLYRLLYTGIASAIAKRRRKWIVRFFMADVYLKEN